MSKTRNKIIRFLKRNPGIHPYKQLIEAGGYRSLIRRMAFDGELEEISMGFYRLADEVRSEYEDMENICTIIPEAVFCLVSALDFHRIGTQPAFDFHIGLPSGKKPTERCEFSIINYTFSGKAYSSGIEDHGAFRVYSPAKTVADCFKYRNKIGLDVAIEALKETIASKKATRNEIFTQAEACRVKNVIRPYMETL